MPKSKQPSRSANVPSPQMVSTYLNPFLMKPSPISQDTVGLDVSIKCMTGDDSTLRPLLFRAIIRAGIHSGEFWVVTDDLDMEEMMAMQVWMPPGKDLFST